MFARMTAFVVWGLLAACAVYWAIHGFTRPLHATAAPVSERPPAVADLSRLLGAKPVAEAAPAQESRFKLFGVVAPKINAQGEQEGLALIAVDGALRTVRVGAVVDGDWRLVAVERRSVRISQNGTGEVTLQLAAPQPAAQGSLPPVTMPGAGPIPNVQVMPSMPPVQQPGSAEISPPPLQLQPGQVVRPGSER